MFTQDEFSRAAPVVLSRHHDMPVPRKSDISEIGFKGSDI